MEMLTLLGESAAGYPCPGCRRPLAGCGLELVDEADGVYRVKVRCAACDAAFLVLLETEGEAGSAEGSPPVPISVDELLDLHGVLRAHQGPLTELFGRD